MLSKFIIQIEGKGAIVQFTFKVPTLRYKICKTLCCPQRIDTIVKETGLIRLDDGKGNMGENI